MIKNILEYLKSDTELNSLINHQPENPKISANYPITDKNNYPYIVMKLQPFILGNVLDRYSCEVRLVSDDDIQLEKINKKIINLLHFRDRSAVKVNSTTIYHSKFNGSGFLFDEENHVFEQVLNFIIKCK